MLHLTDQNRKWWILIAITTCLATLYIDLTGVAVALPQIHRDFGISTVMQQWVINAYLLALAILVILGGKLSDVFSRRNVFLIGMSGFVVASALCGISINGIFLITSRALQGIFGAILLPNITVIILNAFPTKEHGKAIGTYIGLGGIFLAIGPLLGGFFTEFLSWRLIFLINVPLGILSVVLAGICILKEESRNKSKKISIDWPGFLFFGVAIAALVIAIMQGGEWGWSSKTIISLFIITFVSFAIFLIVEKNNKNPLIDFAIFRNKLYLASVVIAFCLQISIMSRVFLPLFLQLDLRYSAFIAGLLIMPATSLNIFLAPIAGKLLDKNGARSTALIGLWILLCGYLWLGFFAPFHNYLKLLLGLILTGAGTPFAFICISVTALAQASPKQKGMVSGVYMQMRMISNTIGMAVIGAIINNLSNHFFFNSLTKYNLQNQVKGLQSEALLTGSTFAKAATAHLAPQVTAKIYDFAILAYSKAFSFGMFGISFFVFIALILAIKKFKLK